MFGIVDQRSVVGEHVRAAYELYAEREAIFLSLRHVVGEGTGCALEVSLVGIVDDGPPVSVEFAHELESSSTDSALPLLRFGVHEDSNPALLALYGDFV